jgi:pyrimidine-nucleoside phosphorylase
MHVPSFIERKRNGHELTEEDIAAFIAGFTEGSIPDYQASAWAMAVFFRGMTPAETRSLTRAMLRSGQTLAYPAGTPPKVDKHSTGGIGDKVSLVLAPLLACDTLWVPMISGRGLGITGGTLDKLESIPGFNTALSPEQTLRQLEKLGVVMIGQSAEICPADKKLYALRDVTGTVPSQALIVASIMSKKLAENLNRLVLDVKFGSGAFMPTRAEAESLAAALEQVGREMGVQTCHRITPMNEPLGHSAGNALEVAEAVATLQGGGPADLVTLTLDLAESVSDVPRSQLAAWLNDGTAWRKFVALVEAQQGDARVLESILSVHPAPIVEEFTASDSGTLARMDAGCFGRACIALGAGRAKAADRVDAAVGFSQIRKVGQAVHRGDCLFRIHARTEAQRDEATAILRDAVEIAPASGGAPARTEARET